MTAPLGLYGGYKYESSTGRVLRGIDRSSYERVWGDQGKVMSKLVSDVTYMAANQRKMQRGIDDANENILQQIQGFIFDIITLFGGAGDTGLDFGDLKYILQLFGSLFGLADSEGNITIPLNPLTVAWNFFSNFILPLDNFTDAIDFLIDGAISTILDIFGEVPILGQALQQLAVIISDLRDLLNPLFEAIEAFFGVFTLDIGDTEGIGGVFGAFKPIWDAFAEALEDIELPDFTEMFKAFAALAKPFIDLLVEFINAFTEVADEGITALVELIAAVAKIFVNITLPIFKPVIEAIAEWSAPFIDLITQLVNVFATIVNSIIGAVDLSRLIDMFSDLFRILNLFDTSAFGSGILNPMTWINGISGFAQRILNPSSWGQSLLGSNNAGSGVSNIGGGNISNSPISGLANGMFGGLGAIANPANGWVVDTVNGFGDAIGSAMNTVSNGVAKLVGNLLQVQPGQSQLTATGAVQWNDLSQGGAGGTSGALTTAPVSVSVNYYDATGSYLSNAPLAAAGGGATGFAGTTGGALQPNSGAPGTPGSYQPLNGTASVPFGSSPMPAYAALVLEVSDEVNAGEVRFTDLQFYKTDKIRQEVVHQLPEEKQAIIDSAAGFPGATTSHIVQRLGGVNPVTGLVDWNYIPDLRQVNDSAVLKLNGWEDGENFETLDAALAFATTKESLTAANTQVTLLTSRIAALEATVGSLARLNESDGFDTDYAPNISTPSIGSDWLLYGGGSGSAPYTAGGNLLLSLSGGGPTQSSQWEFVFNRTGKTDFLTDYQVATAVLAASPEYIISPPPSDGSVAMFGVRVRMNSSRTDLVEAIVQGYPAGYEGTSATLSLRKKVSGSTTQLAYRSLDGNPTSMSLVVGNTAGSNLNAVKVYVNNILQIDDTFSGLPSGASYRKGGMYMYTMSTSGYTSSLRLASPGKINIFSMSDQP